MFVANEIILQHNPRLYIGIVSFIVLSIFHDHSSQNLTMLSLTINGFNQDKTTELSHGLTHRRCFIKRRGHVALSLVPLKIF